MGLRAELLVLANPYRGGEGLPVELRFDGANAADGQVERFVRMADEVSVDLPGTNAEGLIVVPSEAGTEAMLDPVIMEVVDPEGGAIGRT